MSNRRKNKLKHAFVTTAVVFFVVNFLGIDSQLLFDNGLLIVAGLFCIIVGAFFISKVVENDLSDVYSSLGESDPDDSYIEFKPLYSAYEKNHEALMKLKASAASERMHLDAVKKKAIRSQITLKHNMEQKHRIDNRKDNIESFYKDLSDRLSSMVWLTDTQGNVIFANQQLFDRIKYESDQMNTIYDILDIDARQFELFRKKDFARISLDLRVGFSVPGKSKRLFDKQSMKYILFMSDISNHDKVMTKTYLKKSRDLHFISEVSKIISGQISIESTLQDAIDKITFLGNFIACGIRLLNEDKSLVLKAKSGYGLSYLLPDRLDISNTHIGYAINESKIITLNGVNDLLFNEQDVMDIISQGKKMAFIPLTNYNHNLGVMTIVSDEEIDSESVVLFESISISVTIALEKILLYEKLKSDYFKTVEAFVTASELKSKNFGGHSRRVAEISKRISEKLFLSATEVDDIYMAGLLHDVGKLITAESNDNTLTEHDHGTIGRKIIEKVGFKKDVLDGIEYHHLDFNLANVGSTHLAQQPYYAQIIRLVSDFDMMVIMNPDVLENLSILTHLKALSGILYAPQFVKVLEHIVDTDMFWLKKLYAIEVSDV